MIRTLLLSLALLGCSAGAPTPAPTPRPTPTPSPTPRAACSVAETRAVRELPARPRLIASSMDEDGGLLLWVDAASAAHALALGPDLRAPGEASSPSLPLASGLLALSKVGAHYVAISEGACTEASHCLHALALDAHGAAVGTAVATPLASEPLTLRRRVLGGRLLLALSTRHAAPQLFTFTPSATGVTTEARALTADAWPEDADATILALTTDATRWAAVYRVGATEAPTSKVWLALDEGIFEVPTLEHALAIDALSFEGDGLTALVSYEFFRPKLHRLHLNGSAHVEARELAPGAALPMVFRGARRGSLEHGDTLDFVLHTAAGDRVGPPLKLGDQGRAPADVARVGHDYIVTTYGDGGLRLMRLVCSPETSP